MQFTITINGEGTELAGALRAVKSALEGQTLSGEVPAKVVAPQTPQAPQQQELPIQSQAPQQPAYQQPQYDGQGYEQQAPVYQQQQPQYDPNQQAAQQYNPQQALQGYQSQQQPINTGGVPVATTTFDMAQLSVAATQLMDAGRQPELVQLLAQFGVPALTMLPKEHFGAFATALRGMGAKI